MTNNRLSKNVHFAKYTKISLKEYGDGYAILTMPITEDHLNAGGIAHGGAIFTLADSASGAALMSKNPNYVTLNSSFNFLNAAHEGDTLIATAKAVKDGRTTAVIDVDIINTEEKKIAKGTFTFFKINE